MSRRRYIGFGRESRHGPPVAPRLTWPVIPAGHAMCEQCGEIRPFDELTVHGFHPEDGDTIYYCAQHAPEELSGGYLWLLLFAIVLVIGGATVAVLSANWTVYGIGAGAMLAGCAITICVGEKTKPR
jgi:hypothetical protein